MRSLVFRAAAAAAAAALAVTGLAAAPSIPAVAAADTAPVLPGASSLGPLVSYPDVAAGAGGVFHAVVRDDVLGSRIDYLRSTNGGQSWTNQAVLSGDIAATRPVIAADGVHVAVGFVGSWTDARGVHGEAPYLTTSDDAGASWTPARRLGTWASDVDVAVDGDRVWAIWSGTGGIRGTTDGGATFFASKDLTGVATARVAAGGGVVSAAYWDGSPDLGNTMLAVGQEEQLGAFSEVEHATLRDVAVGDGHAYALVTDGQDLSVLAASPGGSPARAHVPAPAGGWPAGSSFALPSAGLAAGRGTVAVATCLAGTVYVSEATSWPSFSDPVATTTFAAGEPCRATISAAASNGGPRARFDWSVAPHYTDTDGDGLPEAANASGTSADNVIVGDNAVLQVTLDGCASLPSAGGALPDRYLWSVDGTQVADLDHCDGPTLEVRSGDRPTVRLEVRDDHGGRAISSQTIAPKDLVVVSLGDSVASGEGSPLRDASGEAEVAWSDRSCHRSPYAGPALAAAQLEASDAHSAVTFVQLACSGAAIADTYDDPGHRKGPDDPDDPSTGGIEDAYAGVEHASTCDDPGTPCPTLRPSQLDQMRQLLGPRTPDAVLVSVGANDVRFSGTLKSCLQPVIALPGLTGSCNTGSVAEEHDARMDELPARYQQLAAGLDAAGVRPETVHITEYFDPTGDRYGLPDLRCIGRPEGLTSDALTLLGLTTVDPDTGLTVLGLVTDDEAAWARGHVVAGLNAAVGQAAAEHGWDAVSGIADQFATHGYCSDDPWTVRLGDSLAAQDDEFGAFHPDRAGQEVYADAIYPHLASLTRVPLTEVTDTAPTGASSVGDLVVLAGDVWAGQPELRSVALTTTGGQPVVGAVRRVQTGGGWGAVASDGSSSVGVWAGVHGGFAAQLGTRPDAAVADVHLVQGPDEGSRLVTSRKTAVHASVWLSAGGPVTTTVTTTVTATGDGGDSVVLAPVAQDVLLFPGTNDVLLPVDEALSAPEGSVLVATVRVSDPPGAAEEDAADDVLSTAPGDFVPTIPTRPLRVVFLPLDFGAATVGCGDIASEANTWVAWAQQLLPVPDDGVLGVLSCTPELLATSASDVGVSQALAELDLLARESGVDSVVGVAPEGWLGSALGDASVARASVTGRSVIIGDHAPAATLAHELGHNLGLDHSEEPVATGAWVSRDRVVRGPDFMSPVTTGASVEWVSGQTWDLLTGALAAGSGPEPPVAGGDAFWVRGVIPLGAESVVLDPFLDDGDVPSPPPAGSDTSRLVVVPVAEDGTPTSDPVPVGLTGDQSLGGDTAGLRFAQKVLAPAGTAAFRFVLDGATVAERSLGAAPEISVTAPAAGTSLTRAQSIHVEWTAHDPDPADELTVDLLVSDDDGATWRPLASGFTGSAADVAVPRDLGGDTIKVRAVVSDGVHLRSADSATFSVESAPDAPDERVVFVAGDPDVGRQGTGGMAGPHPTWDRLGTMKPDGTDVRFFDLPTDEEFSVGTGWMLPTSFSSPVWGPDGRVYFRWDTARVFSVDGDGSDLRQETPRGYSYPQAIISSGSRRGCLSMSADGQRMLLDLALFERDGDGAWTYQGALDYFANYFTPSPAYLNGLFPAGVDSLLKSDQCPALSPDGKYVAREFDLTDADGATYPGIAVASVSDQPEPWLTGWRFVTASDGSTRMGVSWLDDHELLVARGTTGSDDAVLQRVDLTTLASVPPPSGEGYDVLLPAAATQIGTFTWPQSTSYQRAPKMLADGRVYGDTRCGFYSGPTGGTVHQSPYVPGTSTCYQDFDWRDGAASGGGTDASVLTLDPASAPDPAPDAPTDPVVVAEGDSAPGAGTDAARPVPSDTGPASFSIAPGQDLDLVLTNELGAPVRYEVDPEVTQPAGGGTVTVTGDVDPVSGLVTTAGTVTVSADAATASATGPATLRVRAEGATEFDTVTISIITPSRPAAADDAVSVRAGVEAVLPAATLLANDVPSGQGAVLDLVQVAGYDQGDAFLGQDGRIHVLASRAGTGTFRYAVAEAGSTGYSTATVTVDAAAGSGGGAGGPAGPGKVTVSFDGNGATGQVPAIAVSAGGTVTLPAADALTFAGHSFTGWSTARDGAGESYRPGARFTPAGDTTLYAQWTAAPGGPAPSGATVTIAARQLHRGQTQTVAGTGFVAGERLAVVMHSDAPVRLGTATAGADGRFTFSFAVPRSASTGQHTITVTGPTSGTVEGTFEVLADEPTSGPPVTVTDGPLAVTGAPVLLPTLTAAVLALLAGTALLLLGSRRRRRGR